MNIITQQAIKYRNLGLSVIPLGAITLKKKPDGSTSKNIVYPISWSKYQKEMATEDEIIEWFEVKQYPNMGIVTGKISSLFVLDVDDYKKEFDKKLFDSFKLPITPVQKTGRGGKQYFFHYTGNARNDTGIFNPTSCMDVRVNGGMVIVPPTKTPYGDYEWIISPEDEIFAPLPEKLVEMFKAEEETKERKELTQLVNVKTGTQEDSMTTLIGTLIKSIPQSKWSSQVWDTINQVNKTYLPPIAHKDMVRMFQSITGSELKKKGSSEETKVYLPSVSFADLLETKYPEAKFVIKPFFESGTLNMVSAPPNNWKSWLLFLFAYNIASGEKALNKFDVEKLPVMIVNEEDSARAVQDRFRILGVEDKTLPIYFRISQDSKLEDKFIEDLLVECKEKSIKVVIFDSLRAMHEEDENDSTGMQKVMNVMKNLTREGITVIFTHHNRKKSMFQKGTDAESTRGSSAINAAISGHISLEEEERETGKYLVIKHLKSKATEKIEPFELKIENVDGKISFHYDGEYKDSSKKLETAKSAIMSVMTSDSWMCTKDFLSMDIGSKNTIRDVLVELVGSGELVSMTRKEAQDKKIFVNSTGKLNEKIYSLKNKSDYEQETEQSSLDNF